ncbi:unnamed protein product [Meganyctiphanes norvegica]|uniref:Cuticle protein n=1 Tax=Meganyctiphanes norvegica TaxID=48144 RepID=A0AAV2SM81_MEGNR
MKLLVVLAVVAAANCAAVLKSPPSNARIEYEHDKYGRLVEVDIDHFAPVPVAKKAAAPKPAPAAPAAVVKFLPAAPVAPSVQIIGPKVIYQTAAAPVPAAVPLAVVKKAPTPAPAVAAAPAKATYYKVDDGELDRLDVAYVSYGAKTPAAAPVPAPAPVPAAIPSVQVYSLANPSAGPILLPLDWD